MLAIDSFLSKSKTDTLMKQRIKSLLSNAFFTGITFLHCFGFLVFSFSSLAFVFVWIWNAVSFSGAVTGCAVKICLSNATHTNTRTVIKQAIYFCFLPLVSVSPTWTSVCVYCYSREQPVQSLGLTRVLFKYL